MFFESIKMAIGAIRSNKMRSALTMLGIIIGIASVIAIVGIGDAVKGKMNGEFESFGVNRIYLTTDYEKDISDSDLFTMEDINIIQRVYGESIQGLSPSMNSSGSFNGKKKTHNVSITGINEIYDKITKIDMIAGRFMSAADVDAGRNAVIVEKTLADKLFMNENPIGKTFSLQNFDQSSSTYLIIGVYKKPNSMFAGMMGERLEMMVPYTYLEKTDPLGGGRYNAIDINFKEGTDINAQSKKVQKLVEKRHSVIGQGIYKYYTAESEISMINNILGMMQMFVSAIAAISLLVGGIGIMNIMLVSVTERTREIGIRKAIGANNTDVMVQFIIEAVILSCLGGLIGIALGVGVAAIAAALMKMALIVKPSVILFAWSFSAAIGIFFGFYPAKKAAKLDPIDALRYE